MTDLDKLQGTWSVTSLELDGQRMPAPESAQVVVDGERFQSLEKIQLMSPERFPVKD